MKKLLLSLLIIWPSLAASVITGDPPAAKEAPAAKTDMEKIQGTWLQTKRSLDARDFEPGEYDLTLDIQGDKIVLSLFDFPETAIGDYAFSLDEAKKPKWFTWTEISQKVTQKGIYDIRGDELTIKFDYRKDKIDQRPADFAAGREMDVMFFKRGKLPSKEKPNMDALMKQWEKDTRQRMEGDPRLKTLAAKYPMAVLHSRSIYGRWGYERSDFSFTHETSDPKVHKRDAQLGFYNGGLPRSFHTNLYGGQQNIVVDLGTADFSEDIDPRKINIDDRRILPHWGRFALDHVYLERVHDPKGNHFYVLFQVVGLDNERSRYVAFIWRKLPVASRKQEKAAIDFPIDAEKQWETDLAGKEKKKDNIDAVIQQWERNARETVDKTPRFKELAAKYPLVILHSTEFERSYVDPEDLVKGRKGVAYDFVLESSEMKKTNQTHLFFHNGGDPRTLEFDSGLRYRNLLVDLGNADISKDLDPKSVSINEPSVFSSSMDKAVVGHVYLLRIDDDWGNHFYVLFQVVALDPGRYVAFVWRRLPGGKIVTDRRWPPPQR